jgi:hypothetical protein
MFLRLYLFAFLVRDYSDIWTYRREIKKHTIYSAASPAFDVWLSLKSLLYEHAFTFLIGMFVVCIFVFGQCIYVLEREIQPTIFDFWGATALAAQCIITGWANDTYSYYNPVGTLTRITCITSTVAGIIVFSILIGP